MENNNKKVFEEMPVPKALASLAIPTIISQLIVMIYNLADTYFIGQTNDPYKVAAVSLAYVLFFLLNAWANLFGIGGGSLLSRLLGEKQVEGAKAVSALSFYGTIVITGIYCLVCWLFMDPLLGIMGISENTYDFAYHYILWVVVAGGIPAALSMSMSQLVRSEGYGNLASFGLTMGGILNIILDPVFMFVILPEGQEVTGAALATALSNLAACVYYIIVYYRLRNETALSMAVKYIPKGLRYVGQIVSVGFPSALSSILVCVSSMVVNSLASTYGDILVAAIGIVKKLEMLPHNVGTGICQGMIPIVSYNFASKNYKRMHATINYARMSGLVFTAFCIVVFEIFAGGISLLFIEEAETVALTTNFLRIMCLATPFTICNFHMCYTLQAMGKGPESLFLASCRQGVFNIPLLFLMNAVFGMYGLVWTQLVADVLTVIVSYVICRRIFRQLGPDQNQTGTWISVCLLLKWILSNSILEMIIYFFPSMEKFSFINPGRSVSEERSAWRQENSVFGTCRIRPSSFGGWSTWIQNERVTGSVSQRISIPAGNTGAM